MARRQHADPLKRARSNSRNYKRVIYLATEGHTEAEYFVMSVFRKSSAYVVQPLRKSSDNNSSPYATLQLVKKGMRNKRLENGDQVWVLVDRDDWTQEDLSSLIKWADEAPNHHLAISSPKFELFLLHHYEDAKGCTTSKTIDDRLKNHWPDYRKHVPRDQFGAAEVEAAVTRSERKRVSCESVVPDAGITDAYKLARLLLDGRA